jgi:DNA-directed RNA polymerase subunit alpha
MKITIEFESVEEMMNFQKNGFDVKQKTPKAIIDISLNELLPDNEYGCTRAKNCLINNSIHTVGDLVKWSNNELLRTPNLGRKSLLLIMAKLAECGLSLRKEHD